MLQPLTDPRWLMRQCFLLDVPTSATAPDNSTDAAAGAAADSCGSAASFEQFGTAADCSYTYSLSGSGNGSNGGSSNPVLMDAICGDFAVADSGGDAMSKFTHTLHTITSCTVCRCISIEHQSTSNSIAYVTQCCLIRRTVV
jgi:hypothetical protein